MPKIREVANRKKEKNLLAFIRDAEDKEFGVAEDDLIAWLEQHPEATPLQMEEEIKEKMKKVKGCDTYIHCLTVEPLRLGILIVEKGAEVEDEWWRPPLDYEPGGEI